MNDMIRRLRPRLPTRPHRAIALAPLLALAVSLASIGGPALAETDNWSHDANCDNWHPHTWSDFSWSGATPSTSAYSDAELDKWHNGGYVYWGADTNYGPFGSSGNANADEYDSAGEQGSGHWQAIDDYFETHGSGYSGPPKAYTWPDCG